MKLEQIQEAARNYDISVLNFDIILYLIGEIHRLKEGNFTEEEFQNLCHNFSEEDKCRFKQGCIDYQKKLFGEE